SVTARPQPAVAQPASPVVKPVPSQVEIVIPKYSDHRRPRHSESHRPFRSEHHRPQLAEVIVSQRPSREVELSFPINVKDLSVKIQQKPSAILKVLMQKGVLATINQNLTEEVILKIQEDLSFTHRVAKTEEEQLFALHTENDDPSLLKPRPPVITFMGHVDHGKTSLLDRIRKSNVVDQEHGGITQHMAAYSVETARGKITFLDTPGHAAFTAMRARGAHITDIVILVVAADEGVMPQTEEAIDHARAANVPIVVAINKIDKRNINLDRVKKQLSEKDLMPEDWGGKTITVGVSATTGEGVDKLLEMILLEAEILELKANYDRPATGIVVEAHLSHGRGSVASVIVQAGTLKDGDIVVAGPYSGRIKAMLDDHGRALKVATPAVPLEILGLGGVPEAGELFYVVSDEKKAREICEMRS
ncbi:MAG TPA: translation initiation factor IF-2, partial [Candidatus Omnitrophota bacterium]|nr:translation initiation factor IF-2 [Candidatus Omnitrophota bacterium]